MKRKLPPLIPCPEMRLLNKAMVIEVPSEFRELGQPSFQIVSSFHDLEEPSINFKANKILKTILEKGTQVKKLDSICVEAQENSQKSTQPPSKKSCEELSNDKSSSDQQLEEARTECTVAISAGSNNPSQTTGQFHFSDKNTQAKSDHSPWDFRMYRENQKPSSSSPSAEHTSALRNLGQTNHSKPHFREGEDLRPFQNFIKNDQDISKVSADKDCRYPQEKNASSSGATKEMIDQGSWRTYQITNRSSECVQEVSDNNSVRTPETKGCSFQSTSSPKLGVHVNHKQTHYQNYAFHQQKEYHNSGSPQQVDHDGKPSSERDQNLMLFEEYPEQSSGPAGQQSDMLSFDQHTDFENFHRHAGHNYAPPPYIEEQSLKSSAQLHDHSQKTAEEVPHHDCSDISSRSVPCNKHSPLWSKHRDSHRNMHNQSRIWSQQQTSRSSGMRQRFQQVPPGNTLINPDELPKHVFLQNPNLGGAKQILFLEMNAYPNFFVEFVRIPPKGTHIWAFMYFNYKLKFPDTQVNSRLLRMKLLHIKCGDISNNISNKLTDLHHKLPLNIPFTIVSNMQFDFVESIVEGNRTLNIVCPRFGESMNHVCRALHSSVRESIPH